MKTCTEIDSAGVIAPGFRDFPRIKDFLNFRSNGIRWHSKGLHFETVGFG